MAQTFTVSNNGANTHYSYSPNSSGTVSLPDNVIPKGNPSSAQGFANTYGSDSFQNTLNTVSPYTAYANDLYNTAEYNNALARANAKDLREWQRNMMYEQYMLNSIEAARNRDWQAYMSDTAHQREVQDMLKAGLNPVLSVTGGNGASVGSGAQASVTAPQGAMAQQDMSQNQTLVALLGSLISSQTQLANAALNAQTQSTLADKNNEVQKTIAEMYVASQIYGHDSSSSSGKYSSDNALQAAYAAAAASMYSADMQWQLNQQGNPSNMWQLISGIANSAAKPYNKTWRDVIADFTKGTGSMFNGDYYRYTDYFAFPFGKKRTYYKSGDGKSSSISGKF